MELFACYLTLHVLHKHRYTLQHQIVHCQYTCRAIKYIRPHQSLIPFMPLRFEKTDCCSKTCSLHCSQHILLSAGNFETKNECKQIHKFRLAFDLSGDAHRHELQCRNTARRREKLLDCAQLLPTQQANKLVAFRMSYSNFPL